MEIRILLLFFLLIILTADIIAFSKGRGSRRSSGGSRVSSGGSRSFAGGSRVSSRSSRVSSGGSRGFSGGSSSRGSPSHIRSNSRHKSSSSWRKIGSSPTRTLSSEHEYDQTMHHQNKDTSTSISPAKRRGARPFARSFGQSSASYSNAGLKIDDSSSFSHNSFENSTLFTSRNPDDPSISNKLNKRKKTKYLFNDEKSDSCQRILDVVRFFGSYDLSYIRKNFSEIKNMLCD